MSWIGWVHKFLEPVRYIKGAYIRGLVYPIVSSFLIIYSVQLLKQIIDALQKMDFIQAESILWLFVIVLVIFLSVRRLCRNYGYPQIRPRTTKVLTDIYIKKYIGLDNTYVEKVGTGRLISIIESGIGKRTMMLSESCIKLSGSVMKTLLGLGLIFSINTVYGILTSCLILSTIILHVVVQRKANEFRRKRKNIYVEYIRSVVRIIMSKFEVLQTNNIERELQKFDQPFKKREALNYKSELYRFIGDGYAKLITDGIRIIIICLVLFGIAGYHLSIGEFVALVTVIGILDAISQELSGFYIDRCKDFIHVEKLWELFESAPTLIGYYEGTGFIYKEGDIVLSSISFSYDQKEIFSNFSVQIQGGKKTALVGVSGSGKSTLVKLIAGYIVPDSGRVSIDEQYLDEISLQSYYPYVGYLTQEPNVFDGTIEENLLYALTSKVEESVLHEAIHLSKCDFVRDFPNGLQTEIGEKGIRLSGGQRQRLAIAKIFLKNPKIVILDEPTSALDSFSEEAITQAMQNLFIGRTVIIIAHRLQTVRQADDIIVLENGEMKERGPHDQLVEKGGVYAKMLELQSGF